GILLLMRIRFSVHVLLIALAGCSSPAGATDSPVTTASADAAATRKLYVAKCARCHKLYDPAKYSDAAWREWMDKMSRKAKLKPEQKELLWDYTAALRAPSANSK